MTLFKPGDEVFGMLPYPYGVGSHAEFAVGPARAFAHKPEGVDHVQAAAVPLAALTARQALVDTADVRPGQRVLIHAAAGGWATSPYRSPSRWGRTSSAPRAPPSTISCAGSERTRSSTTAPWTSGTR